MMQERITHSTRVDTAGRDFEGEYRLPGCSLFHQDRAGRAGGGVMLYAKRHLRRAIELLKATVNAGNVTSQTILHSVREKNHTCFATGHHLCATLGYTGGCG